MRNEIARRVSGPFRLGILVAFLLVGSFVLYGFVTAQTSERDIAVQIKSKDCPQTNYFGAVSVSLNGTREEIQYGLKSIKGKPGRYTIGGLSVPAHPNARMVEVRVTAFDIRVRDFRERTPYPVDSSSGMVTVELGAELFTDEFNTPTMEILIENACGREEPKKDETEKEKTFRVSAISEESCKDLLDVQAVFSRNGSSSYTWDVFISASAPSELIADYREKLKGESFAKTEDGAGGMFFRREASLYIFPLGTDRLYGNLDITCGQTPPANARSRIVLVKNEKVLTQRISPKE